MQIMLEDAVNQIAQRLDETIKRFRDLLDEAFNWHADDAPTDPTVDPNAPVDPNADPNAPVPEGQVTAQDRRDNIVAIGEAHFSELTSLLEQVKDLPRQAAATPPTVSAAPVPDDVPPTEGGPNVDDPNRESGWPVAEPDVVPAPGDAPSEPVADAKAK